VTDHDWAEGFGSAITVCDTNGIIVEMNQRARRTFASEGGTALLGSNVLDCHPEPARSRLRQLLQTQGKNVYTIEKQGQKKLIYQAPWYEQGQYAGMVEISIEIPTDMPHFSR